ncbi:MAG: AMP-binding protein [Humidesulfovibrio sp.]|uniref:phenylacetate--CoA ligase family protein n=1 Tax=Humidesulfovibrio sp. TaxID=2910988 RepID=UPI0027EE0770|nr:AMP-binding protein [Humidesulfovibrio sp.]MDQ7834101.1 AMP-binding protein [Humidesulfovibrio sp.]
MKYHDLETQSQEKREARQWKAIRKLLEKAAKHSEEFRARLERAGLSLGDLNSLSAYSSLPPLRKKELISLQSEHGLSWLLTCKPGELRRIYQSPGPIFDPEGAESDYWGWAEGFFAAGFRPGDLVQMTFSYHLTPAGLMLEEPLREIGCAVIPAGPGNTDVQVDLMRRLPVTGFVGMASYLKVIGEKARGLGLDLRKDLGIRKAFVAAERLPESLRAEVEEMFDCTVRQGYGTADVGCIAYECETPRGMHLSSRAYVEICDPETGLPLPVGETGEVVVTPFTRDYPLLRLATGDLSSLIEAPCPCGRTSLRLDGIKGRADDTAKVKGQFIYPAQAAQVAAKFPQIAAWQIVITNPGGMDRIAVRLALTGEIDAGAFQTAFQATLKLKPEVVCLGAAEIAQDAKRLVDERTF